MKNNNSQKSGLSFRQESQNPEWQFDAVFIDWLTIREENHGQFPSLETGLLIKLDEHGELVFQTSLVKDVAGSYSSNARIRVTDRYREISFNPSRFGRPDNLQGYRYEAAIRAVERFLTSIDQPPLAADFRLNRVDLTLNISTGSPGNLEAYLRSLRKIRLPRSKTRTFEGSVIHKQKHKSITTYAKHLEMRTHKTAKLEHGEYREKLADHCEKNGVARVELRLGRRWLIRHGLRQPTTHQQLVEVFKNEVQQMTKKVFEDNVESLTGSELGTLLIWQSGFYPREKMSKNTFYQRRNAIRKKTGYDIGAEPPIRFKPKTKGFVTKTYYPPDWYIMPFDND